MSLEYRVPRWLWENFESVLLAQSKRYIVELAKRLGVPEKELLKRVLPRSDSIKVIIQDSQTECNQCKAYIQQDQLTVFCKKPVAYQSEFCTMHRTNRMMVVQESTPQWIQKMKDRNEMEPLWIQGHHVIHSNGTIAGKINKTEQRIKRFIISNQ
jgi:hypothetical protein